MGKLDTGPDVNTDHLAVSVCRIADLENTVRPQLVDRRLTRRGYALTHEAIPDERNVRLTVEVTNDEF